MLTGHKKAALEVRKACETRPLPTAGKAEQGSLKAARTVPDCALEPSRGDPLHSHGKVAGNIVLSDALEMAGREDPEANPNNKWHGKVA